MLWLSTRDFVKLIEAEFPTTEARVREWCEAGDIPSDIAKRNPGKKQGHWFIKVKGVRWILEQFLELSQHEIAEVQKKAQINFNEERVA